MEKASKGVLYEIGILQHPFGSLFGPLLFGEMVIKNKRSAEYLIHTVDLPVQLRNQPTSSKVNNTTRPHAAEQPPLRRRNGSIVSKILYSAHPQILRMDSRTSIAAGKVLPSAHPYLPKQVKSRLRASETTYRQFYKAQMYGL